MGGLSGVDQKSHGHVRTVNVKKTVGYGVFLRDDPGGSLEN